MLMRDLIRQIRQDSIRTGKICTQSVRTHNSGNRSRSAW